MNWWLRVRVIPAVLVALLVVMTLGSMAPSATVPVPVVIGGVTFPLPVAVLLPLLPVFLLLYGQSRGNTDSEQVAVRSILLWDLTVMASAVSGAAVIGAVEATVGSWPTGVSMARDFAGYLGMALLIRWVAGPGLATAAVAAFPFVCASAGMVGRQPRFWAWPLDAPGSLTASGFALGLFLAGLVMAPRAPMIRNSQIVD